MKRTPKTIRLSYETLSNLYYLALALPDATETERIERAIAVYTRMIRNAKYHDRLTKHIENGLFASGYEHGAKEAYNMAGLDFETACAACIRADPEEAEKK